MDEKIFDLEIQMAHIAASLEQTSIIQDRMMTKLDKISEEHTMAKGWIFALMGLFTLSALFFDFKHLVHF